MHVLVSGASGFIGSALVPTLTAGGHTVARLVRTTPRPGQAEIPWNPAMRSIGTPALEGLDAVVHLAGDNIASGRWTAAKKASIRNSRVQGTTVLCEALAQLVKPPKTLLCASAIGYYGDRGETTLREGSAGHRLPGGGVPGLGSSHSARRATWYTRRAFTVWYSAESERGAARQDAYPLSARSRWGRGHGQAVYELDCPGRCPRGYPACPKH